MEESNVKLNMALDFVEMGDDDENSHGKQDKYTKNLPEGVTSKMLYQDVVRIAWPSMVELTLTQLASMADLMMVGQLGTWAITSVGLTTQPKFLLMTMFISLNVGATALVARHKGANDPEKANIILRQSLLLTFTMSLFASILGYFFAEDMVRLMGAQDAATLQGGTAYLRIQMLGFLPLALTSTITASLRGVGDSKTAMVYNLIANAVNVVLNYLLIEGKFGFPRMEVVGASLATIIGQFVAFVIAAFVIMKGKGYLRLRLKEGFVPRLEYIKSIFKIGLPAMLEQFIMRLGIMIYGRTVASLGTVSFAIHQICMNIQALSFMNGQAFAVSATALVGQSLGRKRPDMAQAYSSRTRKTGMFVSIILGLVFFFFGKQIVGLYNSELEVVDTGSKILMLVALIQPIQASQFILVGALRGAGDTKVTALITFVTVLLIRPGLAIYTINVLGWGLGGAWFALVVDQMLRTILVLLRFYSGKWKTVKI